MRVRLAIGLGLLLIVGFLVVVLSKSEQRLAATNSLVRFSGADVPIAGRQRRCQTEGIPAPAAYLRVFAGVRVGRAGPLDVSIRQGDRTVARGSFGRVYDGLPAAAKLSPPVDHEIVPAEVCFRNRGRSTVRLAGDRTPLISAANPFGLILDDEPRIDYLRPGEESGFALAGAVADRFGRSKTSFFGPWTMWAVFALVSVSWAAAIVLLFKRLPSR